MKKIITTYVIIILSILILTGCNKENNSNNNTNTLSPTKGEPTQSAVNNTGAPTSIPITPDVLTPSVTEPIENTEVTKAPVNGHEDDSISVQSALNALRGYISSTYDIELINENELIDNKSYYLFQVSSSNMVVEPLILVDKEDASIYYYNERGELIDFNSFPLDKTEVVEPDDNIDLSDAVNKLSKLSQEELKLFKPLSEYEIETDYPWTTVVNGEQCYGVNLFDNLNGNRQLIAVYYVSVDGSAIYHLEDDYIFTKISE